ncbi:hypothetical protein [Nocardioides jiangxiensis]|uniref:Uncharacterized protein n=1 Tax=Nocardioides jiangxiensis TaxID=3064524 RepID=A0ABT9B0G3_9ACTN|nr:hypothetical protein [Nocardioides sp. WY-20]MDO7868299.1 hypothetical protein [Nocardioides sp. WY-20]
MRHPAFPARRGGVRAATWWGRVWLRTVEDTAYDDADVAAGWRLARSGAVGAIDVDGGRVLAAVRTGASGRARSVGAPVVDVDELVACSVIVPVLDAADRTALVEVVAASSGRLAALLAGDLPADLAEHAEEAGVALLPEEVDCSCTCGAWVQPCPPRPGRPGPAGLALRRRPLRPAGAARPAARPPAGRGGRCRGGRLRW